MFYRIFASRFTAAWSCFTGLLTKSRFKIIRETWVRRGRRTRSWPNVTSAGRYLGTPHLYFIWAYVRGARCRAHTRGTERIHGGTSSKRIRTRAHVCTARTGRGYIGDPHPVKPRLSTPYRAITRSPAITVVFISLRDFILISALSPFSRSYLSLGSLSFLFRLVYALFSIRANERRSEGHPRKHRSFIWFQKLFI